MLNLGGAGGRLINLFAEVVQDFVLQQSLHTRRDHIHAALWKEHLYSRSLKEQDEHRMRCVAYAESA